MPYTIQNNLPDCEGKHAVVNETTGKVMGCHNTPEEAAAQVAALIVEEKQASETEPTLFASIRQFIQKHLPKLAGEIIAPGPDAQHTGLMVAWWPDAALAAQLAIPNGETPDQLHLTLAYFGDAASMPDETLAKAIVHLANFCRRHEPLTGKIGGVAQFAPDPDGMIPVVALADVPGLAELRTDLVECLEESGLEVSELHDFTPHITLQYANESGALPAVNPLALTLGALTLSIGDKRATFPLLNLENEMMAVASAMYSERDLLHLAGSGGPMRLFNAAAFAEAPDWIPYLPIPGKYQHPEYGDVIITPQRNQRFVDQFNDGVYQAQVPIDAEHQTALSGAMGWITKMRVNADGSADAQVDWTDRGRKLLADDRFKYFSPTWYDQWTDPATEKQYQDVAIGGALTTRPFFKDESLRPLIASERRIQTTPAMPENTPAAPEQETLEGGSPMADELKFTELEQKFGELKTRLEGETAARQAAEAQVQTLAAQNQTLTTSVTALQNEARRRRFAELVNEPTAPWYGQAEGHLNLLEQMADSFGEESDAFKAYVAQQQATAKALADSALFHERGSNRTASNDPVTKATQMANARAKEAGISFQDALGQVFNENPALYEQYAKSAAVKV